MNIYKESHYKKEEKELPVSRRDREIETIHYKTDKKQLKLLEQQLRDSNREKGRERVHSGISWFRKSIESLAPKKMSQVEANKISFGTRGIKQTVGKNKAFWRF